MIHEKIEKDDFETLMQGKMDPAQFEEVPAEPEETAETEPAENGDAAPAEEKPEESGELRTDRGINKNKSCRIPKLYVTAFLRMG